MAGEIKLITVCGPTASGKTGFGIELAKMLGGEVVSADSMQIYKDIPIATAQPSREETLGIPHHLIGFLNVGESFSVADYLPLAHEKISEIQTRHKTPILVGGTGLYIDSLVDDITLSDCGSTEIREKISKEFEQKGNEYMYEKLRKIDPQAAERIEVNNKRRIIRALEVFETTGITFSRQNELSRSRPSRYDEVRFFINYSDREKLYERINKRVDLMIERGLIEEAKKYRDITKDNGAGQAIGHKEMYAFLDGEITLDEASENLKRATRRYAKRQITWFSKREGVVMLSPDKEDIVEKAVKILKRRGFVWGSIRD